MAGVNVSDIRSFLSKNTTETPGFWNSKKKLSPEMAAHPPRLTKARNPAAQIFLINRVMGFVFID